MALTPEQKLSITRHLAEKVMRLKEERDVVPSKGCFVATDTSLWVWKPYANHATEWDPFTDANATLEVGIKATQQHEKARLEYVYDPGGKIERHQVSIVRDVYRGEWENVVIAYAYSKESFMEAACLACATATGWEG